jgi:hypothetical protein
MHTNRRQFLKTLAAGSIATAIPFAVRGKSTTANTLSILHTNDVHSHLEPFDRNHPKFPNIGGFARRASLIKQLRKHRENVLLLDAGDIFQGTPYFNFFGGKPELELMSKMGCNTWLSNCNMLSSLLSAAITISKEPLWKKKPCPGKSSKKGLSELGSLA